MRDEGRDGRARRPPNLFPTFPVQGVGSRGLGMGMPMGGMGGMGGGAGTGMGMGMRLLGGPGSVRSWSTLLVATIPPIMALSPVDRRASYRLRLCCAYSSPYFLCCVVDLCICRELAEMYGHGKPPTVTKEETEKSGLVTIKPTPSQLSHTKSMARLPPTCVFECGRTSGLVPCSCTLLFTTRDLCGPPSLLFTS